MVQRLKNSARSITYRCLNGFQRTEPVAPAWALSEGVLSRATVYWPTQYQWAPSAAFLEPLHEGIAQWARTERRDIAQPYAGVCVFEIALDGRRHRIAVDYSDYVERIERDCLATVSLYFKMQCLKSGYGDARIRPGGYVMADGRVGPQLARLRVKARMSAPRFDIYGRFGLDYATEIRTAAVDLLRSDATFEYEGGMRKVPYRQFLMEAASSRICIDLPGNGDFCFRLFDYLAVGAFVIAYPHRTTLPAPLIDGRHLVYMKSDLSDLNKLCRYYLEHDLQRHVIQRQAAEYFDTRIQQVQLGSWYLQQSLAAISGEPTPPAADRYRAREFRQSAA